jgi:predicted esterase
VVRTLQQAGYEVHYEEFAGGHDFTASLVTTALRWWRGRPEP